MVGILFDLDGTLVDSHAVHVDCWLAYAASMGVQLDRDQVNSTFGMVNREIIRHFWPVEVGDEEIQRIADGKEALVRDCYRQSFPAMAGATDLLHRLHQEGLKLAVASSGPKENVELACELLEITDFLDAVLSGTDVQRGKPDPEIFLTAASQIGVPADHCIVVEDATVGINAAKSAQMKCIAILSTGHCESELHDADRIVYSLDQISAPLIHDLLAF